MIVPKMQLAVDFLSPRQISETPGRKTVRARCTWTPEHTNGRVHGRTRKISDTAAVPQSPLVRNRAYCGWARADLNHGHFARYARGLVRTAVSHTDAAGSSLRSSQSPSEVGPGGFEPPHTRCPRHRVASVPYEPGALTWLSYRPAWSVCTRLSGVLPSSTGASINALEILPLLGVATRATVESVAVVTEVGVTTPRTLFAVGWPVVVVEFVSRHQASSPFVVILLRSSM